MKSALSLTATVGLFASTYAVAVAQQQQVPAAVPAVSPPPIITQLDQLVANQWGYGGQVQYVANSKWAENHFAPNPQIQYMIMYAMAKNGQILRQLVAVGASDRTNAQMAGAATLGVFPNNIIALTLQDINPRRDTRNPGIGQAMCFPSFSRSDKGKPEYQSIVLTHGKQADLGNAFIGKRPEAFKCSYDWLPYAQQKGESSNPAAAVGQFLNEGVQWFGNVVGSIGGAPTGSPSNDAGAVGAPGPARAPVSNVPNAPVRAVAAAPVTNAPGGRVVSSVA